MWHGFAGVQATPAVQAHARPGAADQVRAAGRPVSDVGRGVDADRRAGRAGRRPGVTGVRRRAGQPRPCRRCTRPALQTWFVPQVVPSAALVVVSTQTACRSAGRRPGVTWVSRRAGRPGRASGARAGAADLVRATGRPVRDVRGVDADRRAGRAGRRPGVTRVRRRAGQPGRASGARAGAADLVRAAARPVRDAGRGVDADRGAGRAGGRPGVTRVRRRTGPPRRCRRRTPRPDRPGWCRSSRHRAGSSCRCRPGRRSRS